MHVVTYICKKREKKCSQQVERETFEREKSFAPLAAMKKERSMEGEAPLFISELRQDLDQEYDFMTHCTETFFGHDSSK
jgi:hypothetical protein